MASQEILDISEAQAEGVIEPDGVTDDLRWKMAIHLSSLPVIASS
jgi:hypothetical protein